MEKKKVIIGLLLVGVGIGVIYFLSKKKKPALGVNKDSKQNKIEIQKA